MRFLIFLTILGFVSLLRTSSSKNSDIQHKKHKEIPSIAPSPVGPLLSVGLGLIHLSYRSMGGKSPEIISGETPEAIPSFSLEDWKKLKDTTKHESWSVDNLDHDPLFPNEIRRHLVSLRKISSEYFSCEHNCSSQKPLSEYMDAFYNFIFNSPIYMEMDYFIIPFEKRYYDCNQKNSMGFYYNDHSYTTVMKSYMILAETFTAACSAIQIAHVIRHQEFISAEDTQNAERLKEESMKLTQKYLIIMKMIIYSMNNMMEMISQKHKYCDRPREKNYDYVGFRWMRENSAYKMNATFRFSLKSVDAPPGYVVTGMRWRMKPNDNYNIIYIQIQVGAFIDAMRVDESTVRWLDIIDSDDHIRTTSIKRVGSLERRVESGRFVTGVKMAYHQDSFHLSMKSSGTDRHGTRLTGEIIQEDTTDDFHSLSMIRGSFSVNLESSPSRDPAPIGGCRVIFENIAGAIQLRVYDPDYSNMINEERFEKYAELFEFESIYPRE